MLVGPGHPAFGGVADPLTAGRFAPRYDPIGPVGLGGVAGVPGPGFAPPRPRGGLAGRRPAPGEPDFDHMRVPGLDRGDDSFI